MKLFVILFAGIALAAAHGEWRRTHNLGNQNLDRNRVVGDWNRDDRMFDRSDRSGDRSDRSNEWRDRSNERGDRSNERGDRSSERGNRWDNRNDRFGNRFGDRNDRLGDTTWTRHFGNIFDSREKYRMDDTNTNRMRNDNIDINRLDSQTHDVRTVDNVDKKFAKYDDDLKRRIFNDKDLMFKQNFIFDVLRNVHRTLNRVDNDMIVDGNANYKNFDRVVDFLRMVRNRKTMLPRGRVFTINNKVHRRETALLFNLFFQSKDFGVFQRNVLWARNNVNEEMFVHALIAAIVHRDDCVGVKLPALYEIIPHKFHTSMTIQKAVRLVKDNVVRDKNDLVVMNKNANDYVSLNNEGQLAYLTEDIGWNLYHFFFHMDFASWIGGKDMDLVKERRGERFLHFIQQLLARYNLERVSHGLGHIRDISLLDRVKTGYNPLMTNFNGVPVTMRKNYYDVLTTGDYHLMNRIRDFGRRIRDAIDKGYCTTIDGGKVDLKRSDAVDILGNLIQSNRDSVNTRYFGGFIRLFKKLLGGGHIKNVDDYKLTPSVMEHHETALRDPVTYQLYKKVIKMYYQFKDNLPAYRKEDLLLNGVRVDNIKVTKLVTYFDHFDVDITNALNIGDRNTVDVSGDDRRGGEDRRGGDDRRGMNTVVKARHMRLNHQPFTINIDITCDQPQKVVVRTFLGPKFDMFGKTIKLRYNRDNFVEIDKTTHDLKGGRVNIQRNSRDFVYTVKDRTTIRDIYRQVMINKDLNKLLDMHVNEANCGFPDRLLLPKGWAGGMPMQLFVIVTKAKNVVKRDTHRTMICGKRTLINDVDDNALGFPFDRRIDETEFYTNNMFFKDINIYHVHTDVDVMNSVDVGGMRDSREKMDFLKN